MSSLPNGSRCWRCGAADGQHEFGLPKRFDPSQDLLPAGNGAQNRGLGGCARGAATVLVQLGQLPLEHSDEAVGRHEESFGRARVRLSRDEGLEVRDRVAEAIHDSKFGRGV